MGDIFSRYFIDVIASAAALVLLNGALTGKFYTHRRRGGRKLIAEVRSQKWRLGFLLASAVVCLWVVRDLVSKMR